MTRSTAILYFFTGKMASGKSTYAQKLLQQTTSAFFSEDALLAALYPGEIVDIPTYANFSGKVRSALTHPMVHMLSTGMSVILDFPANTQEQRKWMQRLIDQSGARHELHYINRTDAVCKAQLAKRAKEHPERGATDTCEMFEAINPYFEPPNDSEGFNVILH